MRYDMIYDMTYLTAIG